MSIRPDLVDCWIFRVRPEPAEVPAIDRLELLLLRRSPGRILPGLWQPVSGSLEAGESVARGALRELAEETAIEGESIEGFFDLDQVNAFHEPTVDAVVISAIFAVRVRPGVEPVLSQEHDAMHWLSADEALGLAVWPAYRESIRRIVENLLDPGRSIWFELTLMGARVRVGDRRTSARAEPQVGDGAVGRIETVAVGRLRADW